MKCNLFYLKIISLFIKHMTKLPKTEGSGKIRTITFLKHIASLPDDETVMHHITNRRILYSMSQTVTDLQISYINRAQKHVQ